MQAGWSDGFGPAPEGVLGGLLMSQLWYLTPPPPKLVLVKPALGPSKKQAETETDRDRQRQVETDRDRQRQAERYRQRQTMGTDRDRQRQTERQGDRETERQTDRETERRRDRDRDRQTHTQTHGQRSTPLSSVTLGGLSTPCAALVGVCSPIDCFKDLFRSVIKKAEGPIENDTPKTKRLFAV